jgi:homotetrameric cytidine deaminase
MGSKTTPDDLIAAAERALQRARAPYSGFAVGAAVADRDGRVAVGCNVENASYGLTMCAERVALFGAVAGGLGEVVALAVVTRSAAPAAPCGACRQVMIELCAPDTEVVLANLSGERRTTTVGSLLPEPFSGGDLARLVP